MAVLGSLRKKPRTRRKPLRGRSWNAPDFSWMRETPDLPECSNNMVYTPARNFFDQTRNESKQVKAEMTLNMTSVAPICNKGAYQFVTKKDDANALGRKK
jgi:hypothetical protein